MQEVLKRYRYKYEINAEESELPNTGGNEQNSDKGINM